MKKKVITTLIVIVVIIGMVLTARILVNNFNMLEFVKKLHGY